jgi:3-hydroxyacyl-CoA dehydrogenase/enoyl-CoA hydratase/3-hydroxybutyryl-CoA epimerase
MSTLFEEKEETATAAASSARSGSSFRLSVEPDGLAVLVFDTPGEKVNKYSTPIMRELEALLDQLGRRSDIKALLLISAKPGVFIAGADVNEIAKADANTDPELIRGGHRTFGKLANLPFPTIAAIDGACVGGGCETALAMDWRLASDSKKTQIGLPEVKLGILPAWGGTTRLPRIVGLANALDIILGGKVLDGRRAKKVGLVDEVVPQSILLDVARRFARGKFGTTKRANAGEGGGPARARAATLRDRLLESVGRSVVFSKARAAVMKETKGNYPAPLEALAVVEKGFGAPFARALELEVEGVGRLVGTPVMRNLMNLFFRMEEVKKETGVGPGVRPRAIARVGVLGAGAMGGGIAQLAADRGWPTRMKDIKPEALALGWAQAARIWKEKLGKRRMTHAEFASKMALLSGSLDYAGFETCDITIEAVLEKMSVKHAVLKEWEAVAKTDAIFASNTSTLPITEIAAAARHPERVVGMHFFNPVNKMPLVEVIYGAKTAPEVTATIFDLAKKMGKTPVVVKDAPGFLVNRILAPYLGEALRLFLEGVPVEAIDKAMRAFGMPVGPIELLDDVGIDVAAKGAETLSSAWPTRMPIDPIFEKMVAGKRLGRKSKKGFYLYEGDKRAGADASVYSELSLPSPSSSSSSKNGALSSSMIQQRLVFPMINEAAFCLADGVVASAAKLDLALIFGIGFPPFRGGLLAHADSVGVNTVVETLKKFADEKGTRFQPAPLLVEMATTGKRFFG